MVKFNLAQGEKARSDWRESQTFDSVCRSASMAFSRLTSVWKRLRLRCSIIIVAMKNKQQNRISTSLLSFRFFAHLNVSQMSLEEIRRIVCSDSILSDSRELDRCNERRGEGRERTG
eukprot:761496-Hanusia_phi.AAC.2